MRYGIQRMSPLSANFSMYAAICGVRVLRAFAPACAELGFAGRDSVVGNEWAMLLQSFLALRQYHGHAHGAAPETGPSFVGPKCDVDVKVTLPIRRPGGRERVGTEDPCFVGEDHVASASCTGGQPYQHTPS
jgi:hypothetical protein